MENVEMILRILEIILIAIGLFLIVFGWIVPYRQSLKKEQHRREHDYKMEKIKWRKELIDSQIENLYGPLRALIMEGDIMRMLLQNQLNRKSVITEDMANIYDMPENEQKIWKHYVDAYVIKRLMKMVEISCNNMHLFHNSELPTCYEDFFAYALGWELFDNQKRSGVPNFYEYHSIKSFPEEFTYYINGTFKLLLKEQSELIDKSEVHSEYIF